MPKNQRLERADPDSPERYVLRTKCFACKREYTSPAFTPAEFARFADSHAQDAFPGWTPAERELHLISGMCGECWDSTFREPAEDAT